MENLIQDLRYSWRQMLKSPGFTLAILVCLALGIGANSATFSFAKSLLSPPSEVKNPDQLVRLFIESSSGLKFGSFSYPDYKDLRDQNQVFSELAVDTPTPLHMSIDGRNERFWGSLVSANYFKTLGVEIAKGRGFEPAEDAGPGAYPVVILSHGFWERRFGSDPGVLGSTISLNGHPFTIIGIAPEGFSGSNVGLRSELWVPLMMYQVIIPNRDIEARGQFWLSYVIGRLKPGVSIQQAKAAVDATMSRLKEAYPETNIGKTVALYPEESASLHPMMRGAFIGFLGLMFAVVGFVLLLACSNVAGLLMARSAVRRREVAVRMALGISRGRLIRQLLTESVVLAFGAGILGLLLNLVLTRALQSFQPSFDIPISVEPKLDLVVLGFTLLVAVFTGILFGLAPALQLTRTNLVASLKEGSPASGSASVWFRKALVIGQVCLSMILLLGASLALQSFKNAHDVDFGFRPDHVLIASVDLDLQGYNEQSGRQFIRTLRERLKGLPGVTAVSYANSIPLSLNRQQAFVIPQGSELVEGSDRPIVGYNVVGPDYSTAMGTSLLQGRGFSPADGTNGPPVALINETFAKKFWPNENPVGKRVTSFGDELQVVGVVQDGKYFSLGEDPTPYLYVPLERYYRGNLTLIVRSASNPSSLLESVRREVNTLDPKLPVYNLKTMDQHLSVALLPARLAAIIVSLFALLALFLSSVGLFAIVSYWVSQRAREIAIRKAIGATLGHLMQLVLWQGLSLAIIGMVVGLTIGAGLASLISGLLYGMPGSSPGPYLTAAATLLVVVVLATLLPVRKAVRVDVVQALRGE
ncbi:MAG TPA: ABC transporter permease [Thermoanaerobaculia bacterium]